MRLYNWGYGGEMAAAPPPSNSSRLASTLPSPCHLALSPRRGLPSPPSLTSLACGRRALVGRAAHWPRFLDAGTRTRVFRVALERARIQLSAAVSWTRLPFLTRCSGHTARDRPPALRPASSARRRTKLQSLEVELTRLRAVLPPLSLPPSLLSPSLQARLEMTRGPPRSAERAARPGPL